MTITTAKLSRAAGIASIAAGAAYVAIQFVHPEETVASVTTPAWILTSLLTAAMAVCVIVGVSATYLRNTRRMGVLGLVGYLLFTTAFTVIAAWSFVEVVVLPSIAETAPQFVNDFVAVPGGGEVVGDATAAQLASGVTGVGYMLGGLLFGLALLRSRSVTGWVAVLFTAASVATLLTMVLPHSLGRMMAIPMGVAFVGLGLSLRRPRIAADDTTTVDSGTGLANVGAGR